MSVGLALFKQLVFRIRGMYRYAYLLYRWDWVCATGAS